MKLELLINLIVIGHMFSDFYLQNKDLAEKKYNNNLYLVQHVIQFFIVSLFLTIPFFGFQIIVLLIAISLTHYFIDKIKIFFQKRYSRYSIKLFISDQLLHILIIIYFTSLVGEKINFNISYLLVSDYIIRVFPLLSRFDNSSWVRFTTLAYLYLFIVNGGTVVTNLFLGKLQQKKYNQCFESKAETIEELAATTESDYFPFKQRENVFQMIRNSAKSMIKVKR